VLEKFDNYTNRAAKESAESAITGRTKIKGAIENTSTENLYQKPQNSC
jgi:hypothetical protein